MPICFFGAGVILYRFSVTAVREVRRLEYKLEAGRRLRCTQPVFEISLLEQFLQQCEALG
jgi:5,10-methylenetetrahydrofolate reductase